MDFHSLSHSSEEQPKQATAHYNRQLLRAESLLDSIQASAILLIHPKTLQRMARGGQMPAIRVGKLWCFRRADLENWIAKQVPAA